MPDRIRVGIVGATVTQGGSGWGANAHVPALKALPQYQLEAVCTAHEDTAKASAAAFGAARGFHRFGDMAAAPDVDLVVVCVRVPGHRELVMAGLEAGKPVLCEWPLGKNLAEAEEMAARARQRSLTTIVGLQARSAPAIMYARDLIREGYIGEVLAANLSCVVQAQLQRGPGRIWQGVRANGANVLTITGGHAIDALCAVLGEFAEVSARVATRIPQWRTLEGTPVTSTRRTASRSSVAWWEAPKWRSTWPPSPPIPAGTVSRSMGAKARWCCVRTARSTPDRASCSRAGGRNRWRRCRRPPSTPWRLRLPRLVSPTTSPRPMRAQPTPCA